ncbi:hypothetical protein FA15DRAFT_588668 [Coprinopsis marcescibilis]|uniref:BTB domain-containing protein n=1 Tax=Coprinopsis marcescibilis TaxID=230819 RepID=A0A5C3LCY3_COPMA|nr:hypothetical protein FA15DRAFT_588668 [Coprinopsis marcescibilis]
MNATIDESVIEKDQAFYWDSVTFLVSNQMFRVPRQRFMVESHSFALLLESDAVGCDEQSAVVLSDVTPEEFRLLLRLMFPSNAISTAIELFKPQWLDVLKLTTRWHLNEIRKLAIHSLKELITDPFERIQLARIYHISAWLLAGFHSLITASEHISEKEADSIQLKTAIRLYIIRDKYLKSETSTNGHYGLVQHWSPLPSCMTEIRSAFADELTKIREQEVKFLPTAEKSAQIAHEKEVLFQKQVEDELTSIRNAKAELKKRQESLDMEEIRLDEKWSKIQDNNTLAQGAAGQSQPSSKKKR